MQEYHNIIKVLFDLDYSIEEIVDNLEKKNPQVTIERVKKYIKTNGLEQYNIHSIRLCERVVG